MQPTSGTGGEPTTQATSKAALLENWTRWTPETAPAAPGWYAVLGDFGEGETTFGAEHWTGSEWVGLNRTDFFVFTSPAAFPTEDAALEWGYANDPDW